MTMRRRATRESDDGSRASHSDNARFRPIEQQVVRLRAVSEVESKLEALPEGEALKEIRQRLSEFNIRIEEPESGCPAGALPRRALA